MRASRRFFTHAALALGLAILASGAALNAAAQGKKSEPERFTAFAVNMGTSANPAGGNSGTVQITIERWSTPAERQRLLDTFSKGGPDALLAALRKTPRVGFIRTPDSVGWDLHYASRAPLEGGGRRIFLATDRPLRFWEVANNARTVDYPFTLVEMHLGPDGRGEGRLSLLTKITMSPDNRQIELENWSSEPVRLQDVHEQK
jgi:hypothetical protein